MEIRTSWAEALMSPAVSALHGDDEAVIRNPGRCVVLLRRLANETLLTEATSSRLIEANHALHGETFPQPDTF